MAALTFNLNPYGGAVIEPSELPDSIDEFKSGLADTISILKQEGKKVIWLTLPIQNASLVPAAAEAGFSYHHAAKDYLEMTLLLAEDAYIPPFATHYAGAGGVVIDNEDKLLVVCEKHHGKWGRHFKMPGGTLHHGEHISTAVCREVFEETGIQTEFQHLSAFRHWHGYRYGKSDIYFVCRLKPLNKEIVIEEAEIEEAMWMPVGEYLNSEDTHTFNRRIVEAALSGKGLDRESIEGYGTSETHEMFFS